MGHMNDFTTDSLKCIYLRVAVWSILLIKNYYQLLASFLIGLSDFLFSFAKAKYERDDPYVYAKPILYH